jgi:hypothetical protein
MDTETIPSRNTNKKVRARQVGQGFVRFGIINGFDIGKRTAKFDFLYRKDSPILKKILHPFWAPLQLYFFGIHQTWRYQRNRTGIGMHITGFQNSFSQAGTDIIPPIEVENPDEAPNPFQL